jgi:hypothetical protein
MASGHVQPIEECFGSCSNGSSLKKEPSTNLTRSLLHILPNTHQCQTQYLVISTLQGYNAMYHIQRSMLKWGTNI